MPASLLAEAKTHDGFFLQISHDLIFNPSYSITSESSSGGSGVSYEEDTGDGHNSGFKLGGATNPNWLLYVNFATISFPDMYIRDRTKATGLHLIDGGSRTSLPYNQVNYTNTYYGLIFSHFATVPYRVPSSVLELGNFG